MIWDSQGIVNFVSFQITGLPAWVFAFLASKGFLTSVGKHVIFQSAWPPAREAALITGKGFLSRMLQHVFLDIISLDAWIVALVTTETPLPWMCWHVLFEVTPLCEGTMGAMKGFFPWISVHVPFENMCPCGGIFALFATIRLSSRVDFKPARLIARVVALWTNKRFLSAVNAQVGFQIGKFGTRVAALIAIVIFLCIRLDLVDFGHLGKFWSDL